MDNDIRTETLLELADHMQSIDKQMTNLKKEVEKIMQNLMKDLRTKTEDE